MRWVCRLRGGIGLGHKLGSASQYAALSRLWHLQVLPAPDDAAIKQAKRRLASPRYVLRAIQQQNTGNKNAAGPWRELSG